MSKIRLPFEERYSVESDTRYGIVSASNLGVVIRRGNETVTIDEKDPSNSVLFVDHVTFNFQAIDNTHINFFNEVCGRGNMGLVTLSNDRPQVKSINLAELLWIYGHRPKHWNLPYKLEDAVMDVLAAGDTLEEELLKINPKLPTRYKHSLSVSFSRGEKQGMLNGNPHTYQHVAATLEYTVDYEGGKAKVFTAITIPG